MFLSQLVINLRHRAARHELSDRYELHRSLLSAFPERLSNDERVLYRVEQARRRAVATVLVQSQSSPDWNKAQKLNEAGYLCQPPDLREFEFQAREGMWLRFRLQANPTVKRAGRRHAIYAEDELLRWLGRKSHAHGFTVEAQDVRVAKLGKFYGKKRQQTWHAVQFEGFLRITEPGAFVAGLRDGIGSAKAFGFGLLSLGRSPMPAGSLDPPRT